MQTNREFYTLRVLASLLITIFIFVLVFSFAHWVSYKNYLGISEGNNIIEESLNDFEEVLSNISCDDGVLAKVSEKMDEVGARLALLESRLGKNDARVLEQKKFYSEMEFRHLMLVKELNSMCNSSFLTVMFFYSNDLETGERIDSETTGYILTTFKKEDLSRIMIYSFDYNLDSDAIRELKEQYFVDRVPFIVINEKDVIADLKNIDQLEKYL